ncbi:MAG: hypothetical protein HWD59_13365 [Coxiellaceae bacterium]|nr:MAG: hypothetical protein HWD59_13365 [Coxiellaceae bacterium]
MFDITASADEACFWIPRSSQRNDGVCSLLEGHHYPKKLFFTKNSIIYSEVFTDRHPAAKTAGSRKNQSGKFVLRSTELLSEQDWYYRTSRRGIFLGSSGMRKIHVQVREETTHPTEK